MKNKMSVKLFFLTGIMLILIIGVSSAQTIRYVKKGSNGNGTSWAGAYPGLAEALQWAAQNSSNWTAANPLQIWVAEGEYLPLSGEAFEMIDFVQIYGGFSGSENSLEQRNWHENPTILKGNGHSVIRNTEASNLSPQAILDGFTITGGIAPEGAGIYNWTNATFANLIVTENTASGSGGGIRNFSSSLYYNILITKNQSPLGAGFFTTVEDTAPKLINVTSSRNTGNTGPELYIEAGEPIIRNSLFFGNGTFLGNALHDIQYSLVENYYNWENPYTYNLLNTVNPLFKDPENGDLTLSPASPALDAGSNEAFVEFVGNLAENKDLSAHPRQQFERVDMGAFEADYRRSFTPSESRIIHINSSIQQLTPTYTGDGSSWDNAVPDLEPVLIWAKNNAHLWTEQTPLQLWVGQGVYIPEEGKSFEMVDHVGIYGGFSGTESSLIERQYLIYSSLLMGRGNSVIKNTADHPISRGGILDGFIVGLGEASNGAGIYNETNATFGNLYIYMNTATEAGGAVYNTGSPLFFNSFFMLNSALSGGGIYSTNNASAPVFVNVTCSFNFADNGAEIFLDAGAPVIRNSVFYGLGVEGIEGSQADIQYSMVQDWINNTNGNISGDSNPFFVQGESPIPVPSPSSPLINAGSNQAYLDIVFPITGNMLDFYGQDRILRNRIDIGAFETNYIPFIPSDDNILYVDRNVNQAALGYAENGSSWSNAASELAEVLHWAHSRWSQDSSTASWSKNNPLKIFVAKGTYYPKFSTDQFIELEGMYEDDLEYYRKYTFSMTTNTQLFGGFDPASGITDLNDERILPDDAGNGTILSGNIGDPDLHTDNVFRVILTEGSAIDSTFVMDGFTVRDGYTDWQEMDYELDEIIYYTQGAGWFNSGSNPTLRHVRFINNTSVGENAKGGGFFNFKGNPRIFQSAFIDNTSGGQGGAIYSTEGTVEINGSVFKGNSAEDGGAIHGHNSPLIIANSLIHGNKAQNHGGGIFIEDLNTFSSIISNSTVAGNFAQSNGGGLYATRSLGSIIGNSIFWGNSTELYEEQPILQNDISHSIITGILTNKGNINSDPLFISAPNYSTAPFTSGNYQLQSGSPAINSGDPLTNTLDYPIQSFDRDLLATERIQNYRIDIGAYEYSCVVSLPENTGPITRLLTEAPNFLYEECNLYALVEPIGNLNPVSGNLTAQVMNNDGIISFQNARYLSRYYDLKPATDPQSSTARLTLFYKQADFDQYNAAYGTSNNAELPTGPGAALPGNIRIAQFRDAYTLENSVLSHIAPPTYINPNTVVWNTSTELWEVTFEVSGFSGFFLTGQDDTALPVSLVSFKATKHENTVLLTWQTASEINASHFEIERSNNATDFRKVGQIFTKGEYEIAQNYNFIDMIHYASSKLYYRLKTVDKDGTYNYSPIASIALNSNEHPGDMYPYPNPTTHQSKVTIDLAGSYTGLDITNMSGHTFDIKLTNISAEKLELDTTPLPPGVYILRIQTAKQTVVRRLVIE